MLRFFLLTIIVAVVANSVASQECPAFTVVGPARVLRPGEVAIFTVNPPLENYDQYKFAWTVSRGTLESGQGKPWIYVRISEKDEGTILKAEVKITGPSAECVRTLTETAEIQGGGHPIKVDEFGDISRPKLAARLDALAELHKEYPSWVLFFIHTPSKESSKENIDEFEEFIRSHVSGVHKVPNDLVVFVVRSPEDRGFTQVYRIPTR